MSNIKIGLEIHIQLGGKKLFCSCPTESSGSFSGQIFRKLYLTSGELGNFDPAAVYEKGRGRSFDYLISDNSCLVEYDEEPPHTLNETALKRGLAISLSLQCKTVDIIEYMRKIVVDGSNTSGFQRTAIISFGGKLSTSRGDVRIGSICLEEDSARKISEEGGSVQYSLDRLGTPLLEIATEPDILDPEHAVETAREIGDMILLSGWSRKSPEAIRQDVNFSMGYGRVEIKGVPKLTLIKECLKYEISRQEALSEISKKLGREWDDGISFVDVTELFTNTRSRTISRSVSSGQRVFASILPRLKGYLKNGNFRLGRELADVARLYGSNGIMHSDELPGYGVESELPSLLDILKPGPQDGFLIIVSPESIIRRIEGEMNKRMAKLLSLDLSETRYATQDGETRFLRPLPGGERMYPETDVPLYPLNKEVLEQAESIKPKSRADLISDLSGTWNVSHQDAAAIVSGGLSDVMEEYVRIIGNGKLAARLILQTVPELAKKSGKNLDHTEIIDAIRLIPANERQRESIEMALELMMMEGMEPAAIASSDLIRPLSNDELRKAIESLIADGSVNARNLIPEMKKRIRRPFDPSMAMKIFHNITEVRK